MIAKTFAIQKMVLQSNSHNTVTAGVQLQRLLSHCDSIPEHQERPWRVLWSHKKLANYLW